MLFRSSGPSFTRRLVPAKFGTNMPVEPSIVVVGAGVFGLTAALELRARGWRVTVIDPGPVPTPTAASTDISKVVRMDYGADELWTDLGRRSIARWWRCCTRIRTT